MKRIVSMILLFALLFTGLSFPAQSVADSDHPITLTITCDPAPELEGEGTIPDLLFTIRNTGSEDYTLYDAKLFGGFEDDEKDIGDSSFTVLAGSSKEFHLTDVPVSEDQLDREIVYRLTWNELETLIDEETGEATFINHAREATASITIERFVIPELTVTASCAEPYVRADETFTVTYTISNNTAFDITGIRLYDPEQSMQTIPLPSNELLSGESMTVDAEYKMGTENMTFCPCIEYLSRRREMKTTAAETLTVENVSVDLLVETELRSATAKGNVFAVMITNRGNRPVTDIRVFDEINTQIEEPFSLEPDENYTVVCIIMPAVSADVVRTVRFHVTATDYFGKEIRVDDPGQYRVVPYVEPDSVRLVLSAVLQSPYYNEDGKLCASVQFIIRNNGDVKIHNAVLQELTLFGEVKTYDELLEGDTYLMKVYQLDGVKELRFQVTAVDPAGEPCSSDIIRLDLSGLKELADQKDDAVLVYTQNDYMQDIDTRYTGVLRMATIIGLSVAALCAIICIILYAVEIRIRSKLPAEFEDEMERVLRSTKRRTPKQLFTDAPTEQFGYVAPIKLRNYGELTEEEAKERRALYARRLEENIRKEDAKPNARPQTSANARIDDDGTRVIPVARRTTPEPNKTPAQTVGGTQAVPVVRRTASEPEHISEKKPGGTQAIPVVRRTTSVPEHISEKKSDGTWINPTVHPKATEPMSDGTRAIPVVRRTASEPEHIPEKRPEGTRIIPTVHPKATEPMSDGTQTIPVARRTASEPEHISEKKPDGTRIIPTVLPKATEPKPDGTQSIPVVRRTASEQKHIPEKETSGTQAIPVVHPKETETKTDATRIIPTVHPKATEPMPDGTQTIATVYSKTTEPMPDGTRVIRTVWTKESDPIPESVPNLKPERNPANTIVGDVDLDVPPKPEPIPEPYIDPESEQDNPPDSLCEPPSLTQGGQGTMSDTEPEPERNPANAIVGDVVLDVPPKPESVPEPYMDPEPEPDNPPDSLREPPSLTQGGQGALPDPAPEPIPGAEPKPEQESEFANMIVGDVVLDVPPKPESVPEPYIDPESKPDNPPDSLREPPSLTQGGQRALPDPAPEPIPGAEPKPEQESEFANTIVGDVVLDVPPKPEPIPEPYMDPEPEPDNPPDSLREAPSLTQGGQGTMSDTEPDSERNPANTIVGDVDLDVPPKPEPIPEPSMEPVPEPEPDNPPDSLCEPPSLTQGGQGTMSDTEPEPERNPANAIVGDVVVDVPPKPESEPEPSMETEPEPIPGAEPEPEQESEFANTIVGDVVLDVPPKPEPIPEPYMDPEPEPDNPPDSLREAPSLTQGGQGTMSDTEPDSERNPANTIVGDVDLDVPPKPEPIPEPSMETEPKPIPGAEPEPEQESEIANTIVGDVVLDVPLKPESVLKPSMDPEPEPDNPPDSLREPPSLEQGGQGAMPDTEPELQQHVCGIRREYEKPVPARRPVELQPIRRIGR